MPIDNSELKFYRAAVNADGPSNGGRLSATEIASATPDNIFPGTSVDERTTGITRWRKVFAKVADAEDGTLSLAKLAISLYTKTGDSVTMHVGSQRDTENDITGSEPSHGCGYLTNSVVATATTLDVTMEDGAVVLFRDAEKVLIEDDGVREYITLAGPPAVSGNVVTLALASGLKNSYSGGLDGNGDPNTRVASVYDHGDLQAIADAATITSAAGTLDEGQITLSAIGTDEQDLTLTFTSASAFDLTGDLMGAIGSGNTTTDFTPDHPDFTGSPLIILPAAAWGGTWAIGDTVTIPTHPAAIPVWCKLVVPPATPAGQADWELLFEGETA